MAAIAELRRTLLKSKKGDDPLANKDGDPWLNSSKLQHLFHDNRGAGAQASPKAPPPTVVPKAAPLTTAVSSDPALVQRLHAFLIQKPSEFGKRERLLLAQKGTVIDGLTLDTSSVEQALALARAEIPKLVAEEASHEEPQEKWQDWPDWDEDSSWKDNSSWGKESWKGGAWRGGGWQEQDSSEAVCGGSKEEPSGNTSEQSQEERLLSYLRFKASNGTLETGITVLRAQMPPTVVEAVLKKYQEEQKNTTKGHFQ